MNTIEIYYITQNERETTIFFTKSEKNSAKINKKLIPNHRATLFVTNWHFFHKLLTEMRRVNKQNIDIDYRY